MRTITTTNNYLIIDDNGEKSVFPKKNSYYSENFKSFTIKSKIGDIEDKLIYFTDIQEWFGEDLNTPLSKEEILIILQENTGISSTGVSSGGAVTSDGTAIIAPFISETSGTWFVDGRDTGVMAQGITPTINQDGNWQIGDNDTGISATGAGTADIDQEFVADLGFDTSEVIDEKIEEAIEAIPLTGSNTVLEPTKDRADIIGIIKLGQSLTRGGQGGNDLSDVSGLLTFQGGVIAEFDLDNQAEVDAYFGTDFIPLEEPNPETLSVGSVLAIRKLLIEENGYDLSDNDKALLTFTAGVNGGSIEQVFGETADNYQRLLESVRRAYNIALLQNKIFEVGSLSYVQGENSNDRFNGEQEHFDILLANFERLNNDVKAITRQSNDVQIIVYQIASESDETGFHEGVPLAFLRLADVVPNIWLGSTMYQYEYVDNVHLTDESNTRFAHTMGATIKNVLFDEDVETYNDMSILDHLIHDRGDGTYLIDLQCGVPYPPLQFNEELNPMINNYGFELLNTAGSDIINEVVISGGAGTSIYVICNEDPTGLDLTYSIEGYNTVGNVSDSLNLTYFKNDLERTTDNYLPITRLTVFKTEVGQEPSEEVTDEDAIAFISARTDEFSDSQQAAIGNWIEDLKEGGVWEKLTNIYLTTDSAQNASVNMRDVNNSRFVAGDETYSADGVTYTGVTIPSTMTISGQTLSDVFVGFNNTTPSTTPDGQDDIAMSFYLGDTNKQFAIGRKANTPTSANPAFSYTNVITRHGLISGETTGLMTGNRSGLDLRSVISTEDGMDSDTIEAQGNATATFPGNRVWRLGGDSPVVGSETSTTINFYFAGLGFTDEDQDLFYSLTETMLTNF